MLSSRDELKKLKKCTLLVGSVPICYYYNKGKGTPIILLHGGAGSSADWYQEAEYFRKRGRTIIIPDFRGAGYSGWSGKMSDYTLPVLAQDIFAIITREKLGKAIVAGFSFGSFVAAELYKRHPECVKKLFLISTSELPVYIKPIQVILALFFRLMFAIAPSWRLSPPYAEYSLFKHIGDLNLVFIGSLVLTSSLKTIGGTFAQIVTYKSSELEKAPVVLIHGKNDFWAPCYRTERMAKKINKRLISINSNHLSIFNNPDEICRAIEE